MIFYILGKTKNTFNIRDYEHKNNNTPTEFEQLLKQDSEISYEILYDCTICPVTNEQLDYLETCFIKSLKPKYNIRKKENKITTLNLQFNNLKNKYNNLTKSEIIILNAIKNYFLNQDTFSKKQIQDLLDTKMSDSTFKRAFKKLIELDIIILLYTNNNNENIYQLILGDYNE